MFKDDSLDLGVALVGRGHQLGAAVEAQEAYGPHEGELKTEDDQQHDRVRHLWNVTPSVHLVHGHPEVADQLVGHAGCTEGCDDGLTGDAAVVLLVVPQTHPEDVQIKEHSCNNHQACQCPDGQLIGPEHNVILTPK